MIGQVAFPSTCRLSACPRPHPLPGLAPLTRRPLRLIRCSKLVKQARRTSVCNSRRRFTVIASTPQPETEETPASAPQEWETPMPSKRPDIFPEFEKLQTVLPKPLPGDPELPDEELEEEKIRGPPPGDPEPEDEGEEGEEPEEPEEVPGKPPNVPERPRPDLPQIPE